MRMDGQARCSIPKATTTDPLVLAREPPLGPLPRPFQWLYAQCNNRTYALAAEIGQIKSRQISPHLQPALDLRQTASLPRPSVGSGPGIFPSLSLASKMFARIGVTIHWRFGSHACPAQAIVLGLTTRTPPGLKPGSLAYSLPYEDRHTLVFYDRIVQDHPDLVKCVLAHVLVYEITHLLQAENRHSPSGIIKAQWGENDYADMRRGALAFTAEDIDLIYRGLAARARPPADAEGR